MSASPNGHAAALAAWRAFWRMLLADPPTEAERQSPERRPTTPSSVQRASSSARYSPDCSPGAGSTANPAGSPDEQ